MGILDEVIDLLESSIQDDVSNTIHDGNIIKEGFHSEIDRYKKIIHNTYKWIQEYQNRLVEDHSLKRLKIKYTGVTGYFIEMPKNHSSRIPDFFIHTQTLAQVYRYTTAELQKYEQELQQVESELILLENQVFKDICNNIHKHFNYFYIKSRNISELDFYASSAYISLNRGYICPLMTEEKGTQIQDGKHPVVSENIQSFISNNIELDADQYMYIITGPNMGGKSTYLRQNALLILMAHMGIDIPAKEAKIGRVDSIFSRVGSGDNMYLGQSTFMVEMQEIAYILQHATDRSFIIIDEIGRGTSTYDGMSLAWSILKHIHDNICAQTLFATHYHEIIDYSSKLPHVENYSFAIKENNNDIVFLYSLLHGGVKKSYGIEVAKLSGIPQNVLTEAKKLLTTLNTSSASQQLSLGDISSETLQDEYNGKFGNTLIEQINNLEINDISPLEALNYLNDFQKQCKKKK